MRGEKSCVRCGVELLVHEPGPLCDPCAVGDEMPADTMTIVAFLQNMWLDNPEKARSLIAKYGAPYRRRLLRYALFAGCLTGRRLKTAFGGDVCDRIVWEEATDEIAENPRIIVRPKPDHIRRVLRVYQPVAVITFGRVAAKAVRAEWKGPLIECVHPAARQQSTVSQLNTAAAKLVALEAALEGK